MTFWERQRYQDGEQITACQGLGEGQGVPTKGYTGVWAHLVSQKWWQALQSGREGIKIHKTVHFPKFNFVACYFKNKKDVNHRENTKLCLNIFFKN